MDDVRQFISRVNPGRPPTRLGQDGIDPWITIPRRYTPAVVGLVRREGFRIHVAENGVIDDDREGVFVMLDRISFPDADPAQVQAIIDRWVLDLG